MVASLRLEMSGWTRCNQRAAIEKTTNKHKERSRRIRLIDIRERLTWHTAIKSVSGQSIFDKRNPGEKGRDDVL